MRELGDDRGRCPGRRWPSCSRPIPTGSPSSAARCGDGHPLRLVEDPPDRRSGAGLRGAGRGERPCRQARGAVRAARSSTSPRAAPRAHRASAGVGKAESVEERRALPPADAHAGRRDRGRRARRGAPPDPHRHRRLGARPGAGGRRAGARRRSATMSRRLQHRRRRAGRGVRRLRSGDDADRGRVQDLHHHRDDDQRRVARSRGWTRTASTIPTAG